MLYVFTLNETNICTVEHIHDILERYYAQPLIWEKCLYTEKEDTRACVFTFACALVIRIFSA